MTSEDHLLAVARRELGPFSRWTLTPRRDARGFILVADHPASAGLIIETGTLDLDWQRVASPRGYVSVKSR